MAPLAASWARSSTWKVGDKAVPGDCAGAAAAPQLPPLGGAGGPAPCCSPGLEAPQLCGVSGLGVRCRGLFWAGQSRVSRATGDSGHSATCVLLCGTHGARASRAAGWVRGGRRVPPTCPKTGCKCLLSRDQGEDSVSCAGTQRDGALSGCHHWPLQWSWLCPSSSRACKWPGHCRAHVVCAASPGSAWTP